MLTFLRISTLALLAWLAGSAVAQEDQARQQAEYSAIAQTAARLVSYGEARGDALALLAAAKMIAALPVSLEAVSGQARTLDPESIVAEAMNLAPDDPTIGRLAGDVRSIVAGNAKGLRCWYEVICYSNGYCEHWITC